MKGTNPLTVLIEVKDRDGRVVGRKEVVTYHGLLAKAHDEGLRAISTELVQVPAKDNGEVAIVRATVTTNRGTFTGIGDASPANVNRRIAAHLVRMAETRAKARALRDAVNIGVVALEELGELVGDEVSYEPEHRATNGTTHARPANGAGDHEPRPTAAVSVPAAPPSPDQAMSDAQRRLLFRLAVARGAKPDDAKAWLERKLGIDSLRTLSRSDASRAIDQLQTEGNGAAHGLSS